MKLSKIKKITKKENVKLYDLTIHKNHNFFCNNHLIHNCGYRGEIKVILINHSKTPFIIETGMRIAQIVIQKLPSIEIKEVTELTDTERGKGGFGHTGTK